MTTSGISDQTSPDSTKVGDWLFRHRTALPLPIAAAILGLRVGEVPPSVLLVAAGVGITALGELIRLWGVHHIGAISRTRSDRLGPLVDTGPFALIRNPLYVGNILLWVGFALIARLVWLAPIVVLLLGAEYHAIVRWEESLLVRRLGEPYSAYSARVPRWLPHLTPRKVRGTSEEGQRKVGGRSEEGQRNPAFNRGERREHREQDFSADSAISAVKSFSWKDTLFSERGTFVAMASGYLLLWIKARF